VDVLGRLRPEGLVQPPVEFLVRPVVVAAHDVRDPEVAVVDDRGEVVGGRAVVTPEHHSFEALRQRRAGLAVPRRAFARPNRPLVPFEPEPREVTEDRLFPTGNVASRVRVVDPQQHPVAEGAIRQRAERVADVQRARRARREADSLHDV